ncbi:pyridoxine 5'-phosphate synthase [bacterium]|nr:pyridoxine 5'-phosphate synthase [bacterium]|tara:strand:- start:75 stop:785 length:711 start_codon:yes stop_codon:yes gene_type:complete
MKKLNVNIDHVATIRQARLGSYPNPVDVAKEISSSKASGIVMHLREDRRHIQDYDLVNYKKNIKLPLNLEMAPTIDMIKIANRIKPQTVTLVPEKRQELTTEGGLDLKKNFLKIKNLIKKLNKNINIMLFIDPDLRIVDVCNKLQIHGIEINTGKYCDAKKNNISKELSKIRKAAKYASELDMFVAAGHGLNKKNLTRIAKIKYIKEYNIGHSIISDAIFEGIIDSTNEIYYIINT